MRWVAKCELRSRKILADNLQSSQFSTQKLRSKNILMHDFQIYLASTQKFAKWVEFASQRATGKQGYTGRHSTELGTVPDVPSAYFGELVSSSSVGFLWAWKSLLLACGIYWYAEMTLSVCFIVLFVKIRSFLFSKSTIRSSFVHCCGGIALMLAWD